MQTSRTRKMVLCALFAALMAVGANISPFLTIGGVPVTLQLLFAVLAGGVLGSRLGAISMTVYMLLGLIGAPVFAQFKGGPAHLLSPTFGFIISFIVVAFVTGKLIGDRMDSSKTTYWFAGIISIFVNYVIGTNYMYAALRWWAEAPEGFHYGMAWVWMMAYLPLDLVVTVVALAALPKIRKGWRVYQLEQSPNQP